jgi:hypothetical protein
VHKQLLQAKAVDPADHTLNVLLSSPRRAQCTPDLPGCYTRKDHFFSPLLDGTGTAASTTSSNCATQGPRGQQAAPRQALGQAAAAAVAGGSPRSAGALRASQQLVNSRGVVSPFGGRFSSSRAGVTPRGGVKLNVSPPRPTVSFGRYVGANPASTPRSSSGCSPTRACAVAADEPKPRSHLPKPSAWRG